MSLLYGWSALGYEQMTLRAFIFVGVETEEECIAAPRYSRFTVDWDILENGWRYTQPRRSGCST